MATQGRRTDDPLAVKPAVAGRLFDEGYAFDFFQAVRLLHSLEPDRARVGRGGPPSAEAVRFRAHASIAFPPSSIYNLAPAAGPDRPAEMVQAFLGLTGPMGVLPRHYVELLLRLDRGPRSPERHALRDWLDMFNHRFTSLFYRAWEKYRPYLEREIDSGDRADPFTLGLFSFIGLGTPSLRSRLMTSGAGSNGSDSSSLRARSPHGIDDFSLIHYAGLLSKRPRSAVGLRAILLDYFGLGVEIFQFQGQWLALDPSSQSRLAAGRACNQLGIDAVIGDRVWDIQSLFRIRLGPLTYEQFDEFLPDRSRNAGTRSAFALAHLVRLYAGPEFDFKFQLVLKAAEVPQCCLPVGEDEGPILGWNTWLTSGPLELDADDASFSNVDLE